MNISVYIKLLFLFSGLGIVITSEDFSLTSNVIYEAMDNQVLMVMQISANAAGNGASIPGTCSVIRLAPPPTTLPTRH